jgi:hypothetical protein
MSKSKAGQRKRKKKVHATSGSTFDVSKWFWWILLFLAVVVLLMIIAGQFQR